MQGLAPRQRQICAAVLVAFCWGLSGHIGRAQQPGSTEPKASAVPTPIPVPEIASLAESTFRSVQNIETTLSTDQVTATVERRLPALTGEIELRGTEMAKYLTGIVPLELLYSMEIVLQNYRDQLSSWNHDLTERAKILDTQIRQLDGLGKIWRTTLQLPELSSAAPEIPHRVQNIIELIDRTERTAQSLRQRDLILQGHVLETTARLQNPVSSLANSDQAFAIRWWQHNKSFRPRDPAPCANRSDRFLGSSCCKHFWLRQFR